MKKLLTSTLCLLCAFVTTQAQTKVFREVSEGISTQTKVIVQDNELMGYLSFTQLEQASADSFNYKISIMDENLNDIGTVNFREQKLLLYGVAFEQDMLCLAYMKSNIVGKEFKNKKEYKKAIPLGKSWIFTQFLNLNGKIIKTNAVPATIKMSDETYYVNGSQMGDGKLKNGIQLRNLPQKGFALFYGDENKKSLLVYNPAGEQIWQKPITEEAEAYGMLASGSDIYLLAKKKGKIVQGDYVLFGYGTSDSSAFPRYELKDKHGAYLRVMDFDIDPVTRKPYLTGNIINPRHERETISTSKDMINYYVGAYTINLLGHKKGDIRETFSYWNTGSNPDFNRRGRFTMNKSYTRFEESWRDYQGNTYFAGSAFKRKPTYVSIILGIPFAFISTLMYTGFVKVRTRDAMVVKLDAKGNLSVDNSIRVRYSPNVPQRTPLFAYDLREYHHVTNSESKTDYLIIKDSKNTTIYNSTQKKVARTIPVKDGNVLTSIYPAKEGHIMVSEYNKKERTTRWSIEAL